MIRGVLVRAGFLRIHLPPSNGQLYPQLELNAHGSSSSGWGEFGVSVITKPPGPGSGCGEKVNLSQVVREFHCEWEHGIHKHCGWLFKASPGHSVKLRRCNFSAIR